MGGYSSSDREVGTNRGGSSRDYDRDFAASMMARTVRRHRPHCEPAPHAFATSLEVVAPVATASATV
jgi:hypothetical protein